MTTPTIEIDPATGLPVLEVPCPDCTSDEYRKWYRETVEAWRAWREDETNAYAAFVAEYEKEHRYGGATDAWEHSGERRALMARQPEELPEVGCVECDYHGLVLTPAGNALMNLVAKYFDR